MKDEELRLRALRAEIAARLRPVCAEWPAEVFDDMVARLAEITNRYDGSSTSISYDGRITDQLVAEMKELADRSAAARSQSPPGSPAIKEGL
ncbi:MAG: hypothetical protein WD825_15320 [Gemmatimonadaceae bacterium]